MSRRTLWALAAVFALVWFSALGYRHLTRPDEGRYAEISREMVASGDWLTPRLNGFKYFEKPALQYWATAAAFTLLGENEWAARLWPGLLGFLGALLVFFTANRLFGPPAGLYGAAVVASSAMYAFIGHVLTLDMALTFFLSASLFAFVLAQADSPAPGPGSSADPHQDPSPNARRRWMLVAWAAAALAVLTKGLVGIVLPAGAVALYVLIERDWKLLARLQLAAGGLLLLAITAPWFIAVSLANREFFHFFFVQEHFERFLTRQHGRYQPAWYFIPVLLLGIFPWTLALFPALAQAWKRIPSRHFQPQRFLLAWCVVVFVFFSASGSKLASYILPVFPALALLVGCTLANARAGLALAQSLVAAALGIGIVFAAPQAMRFADARLPPELLAGYVPWLSAAGMALCAGGVMSAWLASRARPAAATLALAFGSLASLEIGLAGHEQLSPVYSAYHIVQKIRPYLKADAPFYVVDTFDHSLPFYLKRTVTMVSYRDELAQAIDWEPQKFIPDMAGFARAWEADGEAMALFAPADFDALTKAHSLPMQVIARDPRRVVVRKP